MDATNEVMYYSPETKETTLKLPMSYTEREVMSNMLMHEIQFNESITLPVSQRHSEEEIRKMIEPQLAVQLQATIRLAEGDQFDIEFAYALLLLEIKFRSKAKREKVIRTKFGSLLTPESQRGLIIMFVIDNFMSDKLKYSTYNCYKEYVNTLFKNIIML